MFRMPFLIAAATMAAGLAWTIHLLASPDPWEPDSALAIAIGVLVLSIAAMTALLLSRGRWTRIFASLLLVAEILIVLVAEVTTWLVGAVVLSGLALAGLAGPWMKGWLRERPAAGAPGAGPIVLTIGAFALVPLVGLAAPSGLEPGHGVLGAAGILFSWGYMKGGVWALNGLRFVLPLLVVAAAAESPPVGAASLLLAGIALAVLAWTKDARLAVDPMPGLPAPRRKRR